MLINLVVNAIAFYVTAYVVPGMKIAGWQPLIVISVVWAVLAALVRPILIIFTLPINILTLGLFTFVINALLIMAMGRFVPGFEVANFTTALIAAVVLAVVNMVLGMLK